MSEFSMPELRIRDERGAYLVRVVDGTCYVVVALADPEARAYLGINGGPLEPVVIGTNKTDGPAHDWVEPVIACGGEFIAVRQARDVIMSSTVESIAPFGADATSDPVLESEAFVMAGRSSALR